MQNLFHKYLLCLTLSIFGLCSTAWSQSVMVSGVVKDEAGEPLIGVTVLEATSKQNGVITNLDGEFTISVSSSNAKLLLSYIGYQTKEISIKGGTYLQISMTEETETLDEVVVVGYGAQKKETVTGAMTMVKNEELIKSPVSNVSNALAGRLTGVTVMQHSGEPGKDGAEIRIRGVGTLSGNASPLIIIDGVERESMDGIDMNEIESINVLKDASTTAVYGIRGANGVIILTTKSGTESKPVVSLTANVAMQTPTVLPEFLDSYDYAVLRNEGLRNDGQAELFSAEAIEAFRTGSDPVIYPNEEFFKTFIKKLSVKQQYNVNVSGGTPIVKYFVSLGYLRQEGQYNTESLKSLNIGYDPNPIFNRYNVRANFDVSITKHLSATIRMGNQSTYSNYPNTSTESLFSAVLNSSPMIGCGVVDGKLVRGYLDDPLSFLSGRGVSAASILLSTGYTSTTTNTFNLNLGLKYDLEQITKGLSVRLLYAYDNYYSRNVVRQKEIDSYYVVRDYTTGQLRYPSYSYESGFTTFSEAHSVWRVSYLEAAVDYQRSFGNHRVTGLLLYNQRKRRTPGLEYAVPQAIQGLVFRATYGYADKYLAEFSLGYNGSENFPPSLRYGVFPAVSLAWVMTEEKFIPKNPYFTFFKLRASYGQVGNDKIGSKRFLYLPTSFEYVNSNLYQFGVEGVDRVSYQGAKEGQIGNDQVTWERAQKANVGMDLRFFNDRLIIVADGFYEYRDNILITRSTVPVIFGSKNLPAVNMGKMKNRGVEGEIHWTQSVNDFHYSIDANISWAKNKVLYKDEAAAEYAWLMATGFSVNQIKAYRSDGLYNYIEQVYNRPYYSTYANKVQQGDIKYIDINGDGKIDYKDMVPTGYNDVPQMTFGFGGSLGWRWIDFSILFQGAAQTTIVQRSMTAWAFNLGANMTLAEHKNRWTQQRFDNGDLITMPRLSADGKDSPNSLSSDFWIEDASYLRLKNMEIGFSLPAKILKKAHMSACRLYLNGNNILTFTKLKNADPENPTTNAGAVYPQMRVFNIGLNVKF